MGTRTLCVALCAAASLWAWAAGSLSGTVRDPSGAVVPHARLTLTNATLGGEFKANTDPQGLYTFPAVPVGRYNLTIAAEGFRAQQRNNIAIDTDAAMRVDVALSLTQQTDQVTVSATPEALSVQVETVSTHLGDVVAGAQIAALPLNGRSYTDLLAIQPGVTPVSTLTPTSVIMAGVTGTINPSGDLNPGDVSINGQRESANGFTMNGIDVQEHMNGGTSVIPNLDSIEEFRVLTNNFDAEYGNYNGGMINVVTKSGGNGFHGDAFEFLRNTDLDARNFFDSRRGAFRQNQFGGVVGGPVRKNKIYFFSDYQGTRTVEGVTSPETSVPSVADRSGNLLDIANQLTGTVGGAYTARLLTQELGYGVTQGEPYYTPGCSSPSQCVLPNAAIPARAWSAPASGLLQYIPLPNIGSNSFETSAYSQTVRDNKGATRLDANTRFGQIAGYYFVDNYRLDNPYPGAQGGASVPGFDALTIGQAQAVTIGDTKVVGSTMVNEFHLGLLRNVNNVGQPHGGLGVSLASQGFATGAGTAGIAVQAPQFEGVENIVFPSFVMGVPVTNVDQWNNTLYLGDTFSKVLGAHTLKFGGQFHDDQVNEHPNGTFNGTFNIDGTETGSPFADFLLGFPSNYTQSAGQSFYLRNRYGAAFVQDSWRARPHLTLNLGVRWDLIAPWHEKYNQIQTVVPGEQSVLYPTAPPGLVVPGDPGIPSTLSPAKNHNFAPRIGLAYSPDAKTSIRASYGIFYTAFPGLSAGIMYGVPPYGYNYLSPEPPLFATPFVNSGDGMRNTNPFPLNFAPHSFDFAAVTPIGADPYFYYRNSVPYAEDYLFSIQRQIGDALLTVSYAGNEGHHLLVLVPQNVGYPVRCLSLAGCGPFGEDAYQTRVGLGPNYGSDAAQETVGNSDYNSLQVNLRFSAGKRGHVFVGYTYAKSIDDASNLGEQTNPFNRNLTRVVSSWDLKHDLVATYTWALPFHWSLSGTTRFSTGFPVTLADDSDRSLLGTLGNGVNNQLLDTPQVAAGPLQINNNPRNGQPAFNTALFAPETLGQLGNAARRFFYGPGIENFDMQLSRTFRLADARSFDLRVEAFNVLNHAQFYGAAAVDGEINDPNFGKVVSAAAPRLVQAALKFHF